jgi:DNA-binding NtrC family response regulator
MTEPGGQLIGRSAAVRLLEERIDCAARSDAKVLISGESGVGKEIAARLIHQRSARRLAALVAINCAGLPDSLLESELFGHMRGSFTGAHRDRAGLLEMAHGGTLFLDEVAEMSLRMQALVLRFLETGELQRVGSQFASHRVNARVITATNRNITERVMAREFREDLYYRLNVLRLRVPPLRERREDVPLLLGHFLQEYSQRHRLPMPVLSAEAVTRLEAYRWPGNIRELKNVVERLVVHSTGGTIGPGDLPLEIVSELHDPSSVQNAEPGAPTPAEAAFERMVGNRESFWSAVYSPFMARELTREDVRSAVERGLERTSGSYRDLVDLFNMGEADYKRFLHFLRKHDCRLASSRDPSRPPTTAAEGQSAPA